MMTQFGLIELQHRYRISNKKINLFFFLVSSFIKDLEFSFKYEKKFLTKIIKHLHDESKLVTLQYNSKISTTKLKIYNYANIEFHIVKMIDLLNVDFFSFSN